MAVMLLANELGAGLGHAARLTAIARGLAAHGHRPVLALPDLVAAAPAVDNRRFPVFQAPSWPGRCFPRKATRSFADILADKGFAEPAILWPLVQGWQRLVDVVRPALVIGDHCPTLCLTVLGRIPVVRVGNGFTVPPAECETFPTLVEDAPPGLPEIEILAAIGKIQRMRRRDAPRTLPGLLAGAGRFIDVLPEIDPYRDSRPVPADGPLGPLPAPAPMPDSRRFYAYLSTAFSGTGRILASLAKSGLEGETYVQGVTARQTARLRRAGLAVLDRPPPLDRALPRAAVVLHHGGTGVATAALAVGRPQVLVPRYLERESTGGMLEKQGVARCFRRRAADADLARVVAAALGDRDMTAKAHALAREVQARGEGATLPKIVERCHRLVSELT